MPKQGLAAAWLVAAVLAVALFAFSAIVGLRDGPSLDDIMRANVSPLHDRVSSLG